MADKRAIADDADYERLKAFLVAFIEHFRDESVLRNPEINPLAILARMEVTAPRRARQGLLMAIGDTIEETARWSVAEVQAIDAAIAARGVPTLSDMRLRFGRRLQAVLKRGEIRTDCHHSRNECPSGQSGRYGPRTTPGDGMGRITNSIATAAIALATCAAASSAGQAAIFSVSCQNMLTVTSIRAAPVTNSTLTGSFSYAMTVKGLSDDTIFFRVSFRPGPLMGANAGLGRDITVTKKRSVDIDIGTGLEPNVNPGSVKVVYGEAASTPMTVGISDCRMSARQDRPPN